jgi:putative membrane protein
MEQGGTRMILRKSSKKISLVAALFLTGATVLAQYGSMAPKPQTSQPGASGSDQQAPPPSAADKGFVLDTLTSSQAQIHMSQLAQQKSPSDDVKDISDHMIQLSNQLSDQLKPYLKALEISEPKKPSKQEKLEMAKLEALSGADFDTEYLQAMIKEQQRSLKQFTDQSKSQYPYLQKLATTDLPVLNENFDGLQNVAKAHNVTLESKK